MLGVFYGENLTTESGLQQPGVLPLVTSFDGDSLVFKQNGNTYPAPIHYLSPTQGAGVVPSQLEIGEATVRGEPAETDSPYPCR